MLVGAVALFLVDMLVLDSKFGERKKNSIRKWIFSVAVFVIFAALFSNKIVEAYYEYFVYAPFREAFRDNRALGTPIGRPVSSIANDGRQNNATGAFQGLFENAWVIWLSARAEIYILNRYDSTWVSIPDVPPEKDDQLYWEMKDRCHLLNTPVGKLPPSGGLARAWEDNKEHFAKFVGWGKWQGSVDASDIYIQEFENGLIIGPFRIQEGSQYPQGQIFVLFRNQGVREWHHELSDFAPSWITTVFPNEVSTKDACP